MENKTNRIQNKKDTTVILSDIEQQVREGKGFFSICRNSRKQSKRSPARKSIDDLEDALKLLGKKPLDTDSIKNTNSFYWKKFVRLFEPESEITGKQLNSYERYRESRKMFRELIFGIPASSNKNPNFPNTSNEMTGKSEPTQKEDEINQQKFLLFNYLTAQGVSPEEARTQVENLMLTENTQNSINYEI